MKRFLPRLTPAARISIGLISLIVTLLLFADLALNIVPDQTDIQRQIRESTSERLAVQVTSLIQAQEWETLNRTVNEALARDKDILSFAVRHEDGRIMMKAGNHLKNWTPPPEGKSTLTDVRVPIYANHQHWGDVEISYKPITPQTLGDWLKFPLVALALVVVPAGFLVFYLYMRRSLQYLDPAAAIPGRVRVAFDALTEGVVVIDLGGRIMLFNKAFEALHPSASTEIIGKKLSDMTWLITSSVSNDIPWEKALNTNANITGHQFNIARPDQQVSNVIVNAAPIHDARGKLRGCMVTFYDVTELHAANDQMRKALDALEASREQIEKKNVELLHLATRDSLTGTLNRRAFFEAGDPLFAKFKHEARDMACIMADIDFFKRVNDTYGHSVGDQVIITVARFLSANLRSNDLICRFGGEEFCVLLPNTSSDDAALITDRLRIKIQEQGGHSLRNITDLSFTCSFGVSSLASGAESLSELIELSDFALYTSKRKGRNCVTIWHDNLEDGGETAQKAGTGSP